MINRILARHPKADTHPSGQRVVVFHQETHDSIVLNPTGSWLWNRLERPSPQDELIEALQKEHPEVEPQNIKSDVEAYIEELLKNGIVVVQA